MATYTPIDFNKLENEINDLIKTTNDRRKQFQLDNDKNEFLKLIDNYFYNLTMINEYKKMCDKDLNFKRNEIVQNDINLLLQKIADCDTNDDIGCIKNNKYAKNLNDILDFYNVKYDIIKMSVDAIENQYKMLVDKSQQHISRALNLMQTTKTDEIMTLIKNDGTVSNEIKEFISTLKFLI